MAAAPKGAGGPELEMAHARAGLYGLVSRVFSGKPSAAMIEGMKSPEMVESLAAFDISFDGEFLAGDAQEQAEELAVEYARLFLGTGEHIAPYESVFIRGWSEEAPQLWGEATVAVARFYDEAGLELKSGRTPDHLSLELEAMAMLAECEAARRESGDAGGAAGIEELQSRFCREHLILWVPEICKAVRARSGSSFYRGMAALTESLVRLHCGEADGAD